MKQILFFKTNRDNTSILDILNGTPDIRVTPNYYENISFSIFDKENIEIKVSNQDIRTFNKVYFYGISGHIEIASALSLLISTLKIPCFDSFLKDAITNNKLVDTCRAFANDINIPKTIFLSDDLIKSSFENIQESLGLPFIMKTTNENKGKGVWLIKNRSDFESVHQNTSNMLFIFQEFIENDYDFRIDLFEGKAEIISKRTRKEDAFRNNVHLGATEEFYLPSEVDNTLISMSEKIAKLSKLDIAGVDIVKSRKNNKFYFLEINKDPGLTPDTIEFEAFYKFLKK